MRWSVPCTPARLSPPNSPTASSAAFRSAHVICNAKDTIFQTLWHQVRLRVQLLQSKRMRVQLAYKVPGVDANNSRQRQSALHFSC